MSFGLTEELAMLRDSLTAYLHRHYDIDSRRRILATPEGWSEAIWRAFAEDLAILGVGLPEHLGGTAGGPADISVIMKAFGHALVIEPFLETVVLGAGLLRGSGEEAAADLVRGIVEGRVRTALAVAEPQSRFARNDVSMTARPSGGGYTLNGKKIVVRGASAATHLLVTARTAGDQRDSEGISIFAIPATSSGLTLRTYRTVDGRGAADVELHDVHARSDAILGAKDGALPLLEKVTDEATVAVCAEACGVLQRLVDLTVDYAKQRRQFGSPIGKFQALQHRMADMFVQVEQAVSMAAMAAASLSDPPDQRARAVSAAKAFVGKACKFIGHSAIQIHGGIGTTDELPLSHYFRRAIAIETEFGTTDHHLARFERLSFAESGAG